MDKTLSEYANIVLIQVKKKEMNIIITEVLPLKCFCYFFL